MHNAVFGERGQGEYGFEVFGGWKIPPYFISIYLAAVQKCTTEFQCYKLACGFSLDGFRGIPGQRVCLFCAPLFLWISELLSHHQGLKGCIWTWFFKLGMFHTNRSCLYVFFGLCVSMRMWVMGWLVKKAHSSLSWFLAVYHRAPLCHFWVMQLKLGVYFRDCFCASCWFFSFSFL